VNEYIRKDDSDCSEVHAGEIFVSIKK